MLATDVVAARFETKLLVAADEKPETWLAGKTRLLSVTIEFTEVVAARSAAKSVEE